ncbi:cobalamin biosynthesis protein CobQ [Gymnodinialimonas sp. 2305UL16-5]|uniref:cobalamin biosynthesis protein CobQ n=1 Tax=Gymnodinialimonas mytili TaxID=3126503 RepID=UPI0030A05747
MNTPAHLIFGAAAFGRPDRRGTLAAALAGGLAPDLSLYLLVGWHLLIVGTDPRVVFDELYFSDTWQAVFAVDNSVFVWGALLAVALWRRWPVLVAFAGAALLHIALDFPLHAGDGRPHFWPLSTWVFDSPLSYWDRRHHAEWVGPAELAFCVALAVLLWRRVVSWPWRAVFVLLLAAEALSNNVWLLVF